jgi:prepilin-type N-terminal cleavage/methylation domain-containing protein
MPDQAARRQAGERGAFSVLELLVVLAIIGVLSALVTYYVRGVSRHAAEAACSQTVNIVQTAVWVYSAEHGQTNPPSLAALVPKLLKTDPHGSLRTGQTLSYDSETGDVTGRC